MIDVVEIDIRQHQEKMFEMLAYIDDICKKNDIKYMLSGGTLLGAVRHEGFIPWDDDLDIILMKPDFKRLHKVLKNSLMDKYDLQCFSTDPYYVAPYEKLRLRDSEITENHTRDAFYNFRGIYIDIFYLEPALPAFHKVADVLHTRLMNIAQWNYSFGGIKKGLVTLLSWGLHRGVYPFFSYLSGCLNKNKISYPLGSYFHTQFDREWFFPVKEILFEKGDFPVPANPHNVLSAQYQDYMQIPDAENRRSHVLSVKIRR